MAANFFQQIINLGEEKPNDESPFRTDVQIQGLSTEELQTELKLATSRINKLSSENQKLLQDAAALQSNYDAYKKKTEVLHRQINESRATDRKTIEELRAAGSNKNGKKTIDETYISSLNNTISSLKEALRDAQEDAAKAYRRQREAEENRTSFEKTSKKEFEELFSKFSAFKEKTRLMQEREEMQYRKSDIRDENIYSNDGENSAELFLRGKPPTYDQQLQEIDELSEKLKASLIQQRNLEMKLEEVNEKLIQLTRKNLSDKDVTDKDGNTSSPEDHLSPEISNEVQQNIQKQQQNEYRDLLSQNEKLKAEASLFQVTLNSVISREKAALDKIRKTESRLERVEEQHEWAQMEIDKKMSEMRSSVDSWKAKHNQLESRLEVKEEDIIALQKQHTRAIRDLEDVLATEKEKFAVLLREAEEKEVKLKGELQREKERLEQRDCLAGEAAETSKKISEALENQRAYFEVQAHQKDMKIVEMSGIQQSQEGALHEAKEDIRRLEDHVSELRRELGEREDVIQSLEAQQVETHREITALESDMMAREKERISLRTRLVNEEDQNTELQRNIHEMEFKLSEFEIEICRKDQVNTQLISEKTHLESEVDNITELLQTQRKILQFKEIQLSEANIKLQEQGVRSVDITQMKEDHAEALREYEKRIISLESSLAQASVHRGSVENNNNNYNNNNDRGNVFGEIGISMNNKRTGLVIPISSSNNNSNYSNKRKNFLNEAMASARLDSFISKITQWRYIIMGVIIFSLIISVIGGFRWASAGGQDIETLIMLREKYAQSIAISVECQEALAKLKGIDRSK